MIARLAPMLGARCDEVRVLEAAYARDRARRVELRAEGAGLTRQAVDLLLGMYLALVGLGLAWLAYYLRFDTGVATTVLLSALALLYLGLQAPELSSVLLADEGYRVIASWPVSSASYLLARLAVPTRRVLVACLLLCTPASLAMAAIGTPVVTGLVFFAVSLGLGVAMLWLLAGAYSGALALLGSRRTRALTNVVQAVALIAPLTWPAIVRSVSPASLSFEGAPAWLPLTWLTSLVQLASGALAADRAWMPLAGLALLALAPLIAFRLTAGGYTRGLRSARSQDSHTARYLRLGWLAWLLRRPADRVVLKLCEAHARYDWRFRAQVLSVPVLALGVAVAGAGGIGVAELFRDPLAAVDGFLHPAMLFVILALVPPVLALPVMSRSADAEAAWVLRLGAIPQRAYVQAARRVVWVLFIAPLLVAVAIGYAWAGAPPASIALHVAMMGLLAETTASALVVAFPTLPFSRPVDDDELARQLLVAAMLSYVSCGLIAVAVVHVMYRWWPAYLAGAVFLLALRGSLRRALEGRA